MSDTLNLHFLHPTDGRKLEVRVDDTMTAAEAINELIGANFIQASPEGYRLDVKGGAELLADQSFQSARVTTGSTIRISATTHAGTSRRAGRV